MIPTANLVESDLDFNRKFYDFLWAFARLEKPQLFNTWEICSALAAVAPSRLEVAPGLRPRLPLEGTMFLDLSQKAVHKLKHAGANATVGSITKLPYADGQFDFICAFDVIEHVGDDKAAFSELKRCLKVGGQFLFSVPLFESSWTEFDNLVGHMRRYNPDELLSLLRRYGFALSKSAIYGMQPTSSIMLKCGMWWMKHFPKRSMFCYNYLFYPIYIRLIKSPLSFHAGMVGTHGVDEVVILARKV